MSASTLYAGRPCDTSKVSSAITLNCKVVYLMWWVESSIDLGDADVKSGMERCNFLGTCMTRDFQRDGVGGWGKDVKWP